ncbi:hypothetical protein AC579_10447 [Pseudocercospora musae]|uniref:Uncharacterized protein n=1 Tax=Pseudocercospora musae TaxID=113226 RepID=A0A139IKQ1_9PEZI|nr:hypothetical protein AC579_10447 [Pseudocercospora musae]
MSLFRRLLPALRQPESYTMSSMLSSTSNCGVVGLPLVYSVTQGILIMHLLSRPVCSSARARYSGNLSRPK